MKAISPVERRDVHRDAAFTAAPADSICQADFTK